MPKILPVIHHLNDAQAVSEAALAMEVGCDGVFLISHLGNNSALLPLAQRIQRMRTHDRPPFQVGVNLLGVDPAFALRMAHFFEADMVWIDSPGVFSTGLNPIGQKLQAWYDAISRVSDIEVFAGVAFKYQPSEPAPREAAAVARGSGFIPTTSGSATGEAPALGKIKDMAVLGEKLAIASGMTVDNVSLFAPYLSHILVATGVSRDEHHFDFEKLSAFVGKVRMVA